MNTDFSLCAVPGIEINARALPGVRRVRVRSERRVTPNEEYGGFAQSDRAGEECFLVYIERVLASPEETDCFSLDDFLLTVRGGREARAYMHCRLVKTEEEYDAEKGGAQTMMITSRKRAVIREVRDDGGNG